MAQRKQSDAQDQDADDVVRGLECPGCGCRHFETVYTRPTILNRILRRKQCRNCGRRATSYEKLVGDTT